VRLRYDKNAIKLLNESPLVIKKYPFKVNDNFIIELGMGKGDMLIDLALKNKTKFYLGIEKSEIIIAKALRKAKDLNLKNFFIINADIKNLPDILVGKVNLIWLTFSDPWPKNRHIKRRLTYKSFLEIYKKILNQNGLIKLKTDNDDFFNFTIEHIEKNGMRIIYKTENLQKSKYNLENVKTSYEKKWIEKNKNINFLIAKFK